MTTDWQLLTPYDEGYACGKVGGNEEFDNPYWLAPSDSQEWERGWRHGAQDREMIIGKIIMSDFFMPKPSAVIMRESDEMWKVVEAQMFRDCRIL